MKSGSGVEVQKLLPSSYQPILPTEIPTSTVPRQSRWGKSITFHMGRGRALPFGVRFDQSYQPVLCWQLPVTPGSCAQGIATNAHI